MRYSHSERGAVFIYILMAVALFAALSYAVSRGNRGGSSALTDEQAKLAAQEIIEYGNTVANAVQKLRLRGCSDTEISFEHNGAFVNGGAPGDNSCHVFNLNGGGLVPNLDHLYFDGSVEIDGIGQTNNDATSTELLFITRLISTDANNLGYGSDTALRICSFINEQLHGNDSVPTEGLIATTPFTGTYSFASTATEFANRNAACVEEDTNILSYYQVLVSR